MKGVIAVVLLGTACSLSCPFFSCGSVPAGACAQKMSGNWIQLSTEPCAEGSFCSAQRMYEDWWWYAYTANGNTYPCLDSDTYRHISVKEADIYSEWPCLERLPGKDLKVGVHPKDCQSDHDCELEDGTYASCLCGVRAVNTNGVCSPDMSDSIFSTYWEHCNDSGFIPEKELGFYYSVLQRVYHLVQTNDVTCALTLIWEYNILGLAEYNMSNWGRVLTPLLLLVVNALY